MDDHSFRRFWIKNNVSFLVRYWVTACEALERVKKDPRSYREFEKNQEHKEYIAAVLASHVEHHCYAGVLLSYAMMDEFLSFLTKDLGHLLNIRINQSDLKDKGVRMYRKYIEQVCSADPSEVKIDWNFLEDFSEVRNAIIHANGNTALLRSRTKIETIVGKYRGELSFEHSTKLVIESVFVDRCVTKTFESAMNLSKYLSSRGKRHSPYDS